MKSLSFLFAILFAGASLCSTARAAHVDVTVENNSSEKVHVYHHEGSKYRYQKTLRAGETFTEHSETGENWAVSDPSTNKIVKALTVTKFNRTLTIDDRDLGIRPDRHDGHDHGGKDDQVKVGFSNNTRRDVDIYAIEGFRYKYRGTIRENRSADIMLEPGQKWRAQITETDNVIDDGIAPSRDVRIALDAEADNGHRDHDHDSDQDNHKNGLEVTVTIVNRAGNSVAIYKESPGGRRNHYETVRDGRSTLIETVEGTVWIFVDTETKNVVRTLEVPDRDGTLTLFPKGQEPDSGHQQDDHIDDTDYDAPAPVRLLRKIFGQD